MKTLITLSFVLLFSSLFSQETGSFSMTVDFSETDYEYTRELYFYVPSDYNPDESYPLVVGFRGGPHINAGQFRDQLTFLSDSLGAIIMCPENEDHFWNNEGQTKQLFQYSVEVATDTYNIDLDFIYLTGLSYGGRHATIVAMDTDEGDIPNLRGVIPFAAGSEADLQPNYEAIDEFAPACICIGLNDSENFISVSNNLHNDITSNDGTSYLNEIPGVGHTVAFSTYPNEMMECFSFIENSYLTNEIGTPQTLELDIHLHPNPSEENISFYLPKGQFPSSIMITDLSGKNVKKIDPLLRSFSVSDLMNGVYLIVIKVNDYHYQKRFIVE